MKNIWKSKKYLRKRFQDRMFEISYLVELLISIIVGIAILVFSARMVLNGVNVFANSADVSSLIDILDDAITLAIGAELIKMLCKHTPETVIEVLAFALARQLIVGHTNCWQDLITVIAIAILFGIRRFLLKSHDMVETPDGLVENEIVSDDHHE